MNQTIIEIKENYEELDDYIINNEFKRILLVCDGSLKYLMLNNYFSELKNHMGVELFYFNDFVPNPLYESIVKGVDAFVNNKCDSIIAIGGGSAIDVAKCIKLYSNMDRNINFLEQKIVPNYVKLLAIPTTAGTGSEATRYAVIYYNGEKQSVNHISCIPEAVVMDPSTLETLPEYQKKSTMLDALCHAIESFWSINSNEESKEYSRQAIKEIMKWKDSYLNNDYSGNKGMLKAANIAGRAINITQTTGGHAMCYKLTSLFGIAHGHAAALCNKSLFPYMVSNIDKCIDIRGKAYLKEVFQEISFALGCNSIEEGVNLFTKIIDDLSLKTPKATHEQLALLNNSVNPVRLKNNPVKLDKEAIKELYLDILK